MLTLLLLLSCAKNGDDWSDRGTWVQIRPPPGFENHSVCYLFMAGDASGVECFPVLD